MGNQSKKFKKRKLVAKSLGTVGHITRNNLERMGGLIDDMNAKSQKTTQFAAVDLDNFETSSADNLFSQQTLKASQQLLGSRFATYGKFAKKVVPDSLFQKVTDSAFSQVAHLAASWSQVDLPNEHRFEGIQSLDEQQRNALARDIANQNRALAILGGVTGLAGLPGMLADTLWLLLVSLRTVYQLATVYDKPLTGKQGVKMAYAVLTNADLSKMQEKQAILAGLGVATGLLNNADNKGFRKELKNMGVNNSSVSYYAEQIDRIAEQFSINVDGMNLRWITKFLPVMSVGVSGYYNHHLINEVIGVANATFGPEPKEALTNESKGVDNKNDADKNSANKDYDTKGDDSKEGNSKETKEGASKDHDTKENDTKENDSKTTASDSKDNDKKNDSKDTKADSKAVTDKVNASNSNPQASKAGAPLNSTDAKNSSAKDTETNSNKSKSTESESTESKTSNEPNTTAVDTHKVDNKQDDSGKSKVKPLEPKSLETVNRSDNKSDNK